MRKLIVLVAFMVTASPAFGAWWYRGEANGWGSTAMTDNADGTFSTTISLAPNQRTEWKFADSADAGDWDLPGPGNSWGYTDGAGNLTITLDTNYVSDGWYGRENRINLDYDPGNQWQAVGDFNGWNNVDAAWNMSAEGGGIYSVTGTIAAAGSYVWKGIESGTWDAIGFDGRGVNSDNIPFTTTVPNESVTFKVDVLTGVATPEPGTFALLVIGAATLLRRRR